MNVVDSSGWLEHFADGGNAEFFALPILDTGQLVVPTLSLYEVFKRVLQQRGRPAATQAISLMGQGRVVDLDTPIALAAAALSLEHRLPMADSIMLASAQAHGATLWTQDQDFARIPGVRYRSKPGESP